MSIDHILFFWLKEAVDRLPFLIQQIWVLQHDYQRLDFLRERAVVSAAHLQRFAFPVWAVWRCLLPPSPPGAWAYFAPHQNDFSCQYKSVGGKGQRSGMRRFPFWSNIKNDSILIFYTGNPIFRKKIQLVKGWISEIYEHTTSKHLSPF